MREIDLQVGGCVNGAPVAVQGTAALDEDGRGELRLEVPDVPMRWDAAFLLPMLWDGLALARAVDDLPAYFEARQVLYDEQRREVGSAILVAEVVRDGERLACRGQLVDAVYRLEPGERVAAVEDVRRGAVLALGNDRGVVVAAWVFRTLRGNAYWAVTTTIGDGLTGGKAMAGRDDAVELRIAGVRILARLR